MNYFWSLLRLISLTSLLLSCAAPSKKGEYPEFPIEEFGREEIYFNPSSILGSGLSASRRGANQHSCIHRARFEYQGGEYQTLLQRISTPSDLTPRADYESIKPFAEYAKHELRKAQRQDIEPISLLITLKMGERTAQLQEESIRFSRKAIQLIQENRQQEFFHLCGTDYVDSIRFTSTAQIWLQFYPKSETEQQQLMEITTTSSQQLWPLQQLSSLVTPENSALVIQYAGDQPLLLYHLFQPEQPYLSSLLQQLSQAVNRSGGGPIDRYSSRRWSQLLVAKNRGFTRTEREKSILYSPEQTFNTLKILQDRVDEGEDRRRLAQVIKHQECVDNTQDLTSLFYGCRQTALTENRANPLLTTACINLQKNIDKIFQRCPRVERSFRELIPNAQDTAPTQISLGQPLNDRGEIIANECHFSASRNRLNSLQDIQQHFLHYPVQVNDYDPIHYFGGYRQVGFSAKMGSDIRFSPLLIEMVRDNPAEFSLRCGSHYVDQIKHQRGFLYRWSAEKEPQFELKPFGIGPQERENLAINIRTLQQMQEGRESILSTFRNPHAAEPLRLHITPWRDYFLRAENSPDSLQAIISEVDSLIQSKTIENLSSSHNLPD